MVGFPDLSLACPCRKPGDGVEFFTQMRLILKKGEGRQGLPCPEVRAAQSSAFRHPPGQPASSPHTRLPPSLESSLQEALTHVPLAGPVAQWGTSPC